MVALKVERQTCNSQVADTTAGQVPPCSGPSQATYTCVPLWPSSTIWYQPKGSYTLQLGR